MAAASGGRPACNLSDLASSASPDPGGSGGLAQVVSWRDRSPPNGQQQGRIPPSTDSSLECHAPPLSRDSSLECHSPPLSRGGSLEYHVILKDTVCASGGSIDPVSRSRKAVQDSVMGTIEAIALASSARTTVEGLGASGEFSSPAHSPWIIVDADDSQRVDIDHHTLSIRDTGHEALSTSAVPVEECSPGTSHCLFSALALRWQRRCLALVQNVHFLPFGPSGTSPRDPQLLKVSLYVEG